MVYNICLMKLYHTIHYKIILHIDGQTLTRRHKTPHSNCWCFNAIALSVRAIFKASVYLNTSN